MREIPTRLVSGEATVKTMNKGALNFGAIVMSSPV